MIEDETYEQIEAYLEGSLLGAEKDAFEARLLSDSDFSEVVRKSRAAYQLLEVSVADRAVQMAVQEAEEAPTISLRRTRRLRLFAATIAGLFILNLAYFFANSQFNSIALAQSHYQSYDVAGMRGVQSLSEVKSLLAAKEYQAAIPLLQSIPQADPGYVEGRMYLGNALYQVRRPRDAARVFQQVAEANDVRFSQAADWYLALSLLADHQNDQASETLQSISQQATHPYRDEANGLLEELGSFWRTIPGIK